MLIDWFTVAAEVVNFAILVLLMKRFLYKPILDAVNMRETLIAAELADAAAKKADAQKDRDEFQHKNDDFDTQRAALLARATDAAKVEGKRILDESRTTTADLAAKQQAALKSGIEAQRATVSTKTAYEVFAIARKTLSDLADTSLEERIVAVFIQRLNALPPAQKALLNPPPNSAAQPVQVRTSSELPPPQRGEVEGAIKAAAGSAIPVQFSTATDMIGGIEMTFNGQKLAWSIGDYLTSLQNAPSAAPVEAKAT
jgi:F-type H+-transporting ATPase subunit b